MTWCAFLSWNFKPLSGSSTGSPLIWLEQCRFQAPSLALWARWRQSMQMKSTWSKQTNTNAAAKNICLTCGRICWRTTTAEQNKKRSNNDKFCSINVWEQQGRLNSTPQRSQQPLSTSCGSVAGKSRADPTHNVSTRAASALEHWRDVNN